MIICESAGGAIDCNFMDGWMSRILEEIVPLDQILSTIKEKETHTHIRTRRHTNTTYKNDKHESPVEVCHVLLQLCDPVQFVEEPLVDGGQLVDLIDSHPAVKGLKR